jgi:predicted permease
MGPLLDDARAVGGVTVIARLRQGAMLADARADVAAIAVATGQLMPVSSRGTTPWDGNVVSLFEAQLDPQLRALIRLVTLAVVALLLIVCANHVCLVLARIKERTRDASVHRALGASGWRLGYQSLAENVLPIGLGGTFGVILAPALTSAVVARWPERTGTLVLLRQTGPLQAQSYGFDWEVLGFGVLLCVAITVIVSAWPVWRIARSDPAEWLGERHGRRRGSHARGQSSLVVIEISLATALLIGALLITQSLARLLNEDIGLATNDLNVSALNFSQAAPTPELRGRLALELTDHLAQLPNVSAAAIDTCMPLDAFSCSYSQRLLIDGDISGSQGIPPVAVHFVTPNYFETLGISVVVGETFSGQTVIDGPPPVWIDEALATRYFGTRSAIGRTIDTGAVREATIVGIVGSVRHGDMAQRPQGAVYYPLQRLSGTSPVHLYVRSRSATDLAMSDLRTVTSKLHPLIAVYDLLRMDEIVEESTRNRSLVRNLLVAFASIAVALAIVGVYNVLTYVVVQTTREIGIRVAVGALPSRIVRLALQDAGALIGPGLLLGGAAGYVGSAALEAFMYGTVRTEWQTYLAVSLLISLAGFLAAWIPARRAARVDPAVALRVG